MQRATGFWCCYCITGGRESCEAGFCWLLTGAVGLTGVVCGVCCATVSSGLSSLASDRIIMREYGFPA